MQGGKDVLNNALVSYNFKISSNELNFRASKVRNIEQTLELEEIREGGLNGFVHTLVKSPQKSKKLVFERCYCAADDSMAMESLLGIPQAGPLLISIYDRTQQKIRKAYRVNGWMVVKWGLGELDAVNGKLLLETVEVVYQTLENGSPNGKG